ncbi:D-alanyl-D-alanine carboxypeptidase family protein [Porticoccaceae bacterium LTM1]|nr:D-alanyl-D-alanine carboxypeptidase family protein [Porticoccaceae bacterium LTM1]
MLKKLLISVSLLFASLAASAATTLIPEPPELSAKGWILVDADTGEVLVERNANEQLEPASLTKMMTSYLVSKEIHEGKISEEDMVPISVKAWRMRGSKMFIREGTEVKLIDLLRGVIIQSGNDASVALAEFLAGSEDAFADLMNQQAQMLGMTNTHFVNATGWPAEGHLTTAHDLSLLARALVNDHPEHYSIYSEKEFKYNIDKPQLNRNRLLWRDKSVDGIKTGHTDAAGYCLVASAKRDGMRLISVVMGTDSDNARATESQKLLSYGFRFYETKKMFDANQALKENARVWYGVNDYVNLVVADETRLTMPRGAGDALELDLELPEQLEAPIAKGQELGSVTVRHGDEVIKKLPLVADREVEQAGFFARLWDSIKLFFIGIFS